MAIDNTLIDPEIQNLISSLGLNDTWKASEGQRLIERALSALKAHSAADEVARQARASMCRKWIEARDAYVTLDNAWRRAIRDLDNEPRKPKRRRRVPLVPDNFVKLAQKLFDRVLQSLEAQDMVASAGYDTTRLLQEREKVVTFDEVLHSLKEARRAQRVAARSRENALSQLQAWYDGYMGLVRRSYRAGVAISMEMTGTTPRPSQGYQKPRVPFSHDPH